MHFIFIFFSLSTQSIALALASFVCLPTAADQLVVFCFVFFYFFFSCLLCGEGISFFFCVHFCAHSSCHRRTRWSCLFSWTLCASFFLSSSTSCVGDCVSSKLLRCVVGGCCCCCCCCWSGICACVCLEDLEWSQIDFCLCVWWDCWGRWRS